MTMKAILFDIDGTLVDSNDHHVSAWDETFRAAGQAFDRQTIHDQIGKGTDMLVPTLMPEADKATQEQLGEAYGDAFKSRYLRQVVPFPKAGEWLRHASERGRKIVLAWSASRKEVDHYVDLLDARDIVDAGTSSDDVEKTKPAPDIFSVALKKVGGVGPEETIVVGDTPYDVEAVGKCGIAAIGLLSGGFTEQALRAAGAIAIYADAEALLADYARSPLGT